MISKLSITSRNGPITERRPPTPLPAVKSTFFKGVNPIFLIQYSISGTWTNCHKVPKRYFRFSIARPHTEIVIKQNVLSKLTGNVCSTVSRSLDVHRSLSRLGSPIPFTHSLLLPMLLSAKAADYVL